jgi:hypothetical protein
VSISWTEDCQVVDDAFEELQQKTGSMKISQ